MVIFKLGIKQRQTAAYPYYLEAGNNVLIGKSTSWQMEYLVSCTAEIMSGYNATLPYPMKEFLVHHAHSWQAIHQHSHVI